MVQTSLGQNSSPRVILTDQIRAQQEAFYNVGYRAGRQAQLGRQNIETCGAVFQQPQIGLLDRSQAQFVEFFKGTRTVKMVETDCGLA